MDEDYRISEPKTTFNFCYIFFIFPETKIKIIDLHLKQYVVVILDEACEHGCTIWANEGRRE